MAQTKDKWKALATDPSLPDIFAFNSDPLLAGLWVLMASKAHHDEAFLSYKQISEVLQDSLDIPLDEISLKRAFARAGNRVIRRKPDGCLKISHPGEVQLAKYITHLPLQVVYVEPKTPRTARKNLEALINSIRPTDLLINDPYYGLAALDVIEMFLSHHLSVKFMTLKVGGGEKIDAVAQRIREMKVEFKGKFEIRMGEASNMHDRYIVADDSFFLVGQGIKDLGNKESFILAIDDKVGRDIRTSLQANFLSRWAIANHV